MENVAKTTKQIKQKESKLIEGLRKDAKLDKEMRNEFLSIATIFLENFSENINKTSLELNKEIPIGVDTWKDFLNYPIVRQYIQSFKDEQINLRADTELMQGNKDAVNIKKVMQNAGPAINNSNIVLIRLPEKVDM